MSDRAGIFEDFTIDGFEAAKPVATPPADAVRKVSENSSFRSREPQASRNKRPPRVYRTGRNVQLNVKVRPETMQAFYDIADRHGWVLGETLERAIESLRKDLQ